VIGYHNQLVTFKMLHATRNIIRSKVLAKPLKIIKNGLELTRGVNKHKTCAYHKIPQTALETGDGSGLMCFHIPIRRVVDGQGKESKMR